MVEEIPPKWRKALCGSMYSGVDALFEHLLPKGRRGPLLVSSHKAPAVRAAGNAEVARKPAQDQECRRQPRPVQSVVAGECLCVLRCLDFAGTSRSERLEHRPFAEAHGTCSPYSWSLVAG